MNRAKHSNKSSDNHSRGGRVNLVDVELVPGMSRIDSHSGSERQYWHILHRGLHVGRAIVVAKHPESTDNPDASITVELNARSRGKGIGTIAFRKACELSGYREVYASIRKDNIASYKAVIRAGFIRLDDEPDRELLMVWHRK